MKDLSKRVSLSWLADFYGGLLTERQKRILSLHCDEDLSLSEIAAELNISRQAAHENLLRASEKLTRLEALVGAAKRFRDVMTDIEAAIALMKDKEYTTASERLESLLDSIREEENGL